MTQFDKDLLKATLTAQLNVSQHDTLKILCNLHYRMETGKTCRADLSFQVLNAYDLFVNYIDVFIHDYQDYFTLMQIHFEGNHVMV